MSVVGPFMLLGISAFFLSFSHVVGNATQIPGILRTTGSAGGLVEVLGFCMVIGGSLGLMGVAADHLRAGDKLGVRLSSLVVFSLALILTVVSLGNNTLGWFSAWLLVTVASMAVMYFARTRDALPRRSFAALMASRWGWLSAVLPTTLYALTYLDVTGPRRRIPGAVLVFMALVAMVLMLEVLVRRRRLRRLIARATPGRAPHPGEVRQLEELGVGDAWYRLRSERMSERLPYRSAPGSWLHGDPQRVLSSIRRFLSCAGGTAVVALAALLLLLRAERPAPPGVGTPFVPVRGAHPGEHGYPTSRLDCPALRSAHRSLARCDDEEPGPNAAGDEAPVE